MLKQTSEEESSSWVSETSWTLTGRQEMRGLFPGWKESGGKLTHAHGGSARCLCWEHARHTSGMCNVCSVDEWDRPAGPFRAQVLKLSHWPLTSPISVFSPVKWDFKSGATSRGCSAWENIRKHLNTLPGNLWLWTDSSSLHHQCPCYYFRCGGGPWEVTELVIIFADLGHLQNQSACSKFR